MKHLEFSEDNLEFALELLREHYDNVNSSIHRFVHNLMTLGFDTHMRKEKLMAKCMETMINKVNQSIQSLNTFEAETLRWDPIIGYSIICKFDDKTLAEWETNFVKMLLKEDSFTLGNSEDLAQRRLLWRGNLMKMKNFVTSILNHARV